MIEIFMIDTETTGPVFKKDKLLEIGIVKFHLDLDKNALIPQSHYHTFIHTSKKPKSDFAKKFQLDLYKQCNLTKKRPYKAIKKEVKDFLGHNAKLIGRNLYFDMYFLKEEKILNSTQIIKNKFINDYDYNLFEINSFLEIEKAMGKTESEAIEELVSFDSEIQLGTDQEHNAIYDCLKQAKIINGFLKKYNIKFKK